MSSNVFLEFDGFEGSSRPRQDGSGSSLLERVVSFFYDSVGEFSKLSPFDSLYDFWVSRLDALSLPDGLGQVFLQGVVDGLHYKNVYNFDSCAGVFVSCLVENYFKGDNLVLDLSELDFGLSYLGLRLKDKRLEIVGGDVGDLYGGDAEGSRFVVGGSVDYGCGNESRGCSYVVEGDVGEHCGYGAEGSRFVVGGSAGAGCGACSKGCSYVINDNVSNYCGSGANKSEFVIGGSVGYYCGNESRGCSYVVKGDVGSSCGYEAVECDFFIGGDVGVGCGGYSKDCVFKTPNKNTYEKICDSIAESNSVQLVDENGSVLKEFKK